MLRLIKRYQILYGITIVVLSFCIVALCVIIYQMHNDYKSRQRKDKISLTYLQMRTKKQKVILNRQMKKWLQDVQNVKKKYYKIIVKGYGSIGNVKNGFGKIYPSLRVYCVKENQFSIDGNILKYDDNVFCGAWQILEMTPQDYIYNVLTKCLNNKQSNQ